MKYRPLSSLAILAAALLSACPPGLTVGAAGEPAAAETAVRRADADWAAAANAASVDRWMAFYAADATALLPDDRLASGRELLRQSVTRLLALPHLSIAWRPIEVHVARSGDLAFLVGAYDMHFVDARGAPVSNRGRRIEIWRRQADGPWRCIVDTWYREEQSAAPPIAPPIAPPMAPPTSAQGSAPAAPAAIPAAPPPVPTAPAPVPTAPPAQAEAPPPAAAPDTGPPRPSRSAAKYGEMPLDYHKAIRQYFKEHLKNPDSVQYQEITAPEQGSMTALSGALFMSEKRQYGWTVNATINAKNSHDSYVGLKTYTFLFRGEKIIDVRLPLPSDEMN